MTDLRALTIRQPWASLIAAGVKTIETRSWRTSYRGPVLIHAGKAEPLLHAYQALPLPQSMAWLRACRQAGLSSPDARQFVSGYQGTWWPDARLMPLGAVVAVADLTDCVPIRASITVGEYDRNERCVQVPNPDLIQRACLMERWVGGGEVIKDIDDQLPLGDFTPGRWALLLDDVRPLPEPVPAKGRPGVWTPDDDLTDHINKEMTP